jgi:hypothetical protein
MKFSDPMVWRCFSQVRDRVANDNMTPFMMMQAARDMERWAAVRADSASFASMCFVAATTAQRMRTDARKQA